ncbi:hypothetical protein MNBD_GAMMA05-1028 [hydrothermal vent metagenome]|uniref:Yip1 domain-containing protein n=1 Tax=hydrothermal vent metagenome TaxID=652676 RepID=A0A3B0X5G7_9ZZZZ
MSDLQKLLSMLLLKAAPQDMPYSVQKTAQMAMAYLFSGIIVLQTTLNPESILAGLLLGFFVQYGFVYIVLKALDRKPRFMQSFYAILGVGVIFNIMSWPIFSVMADELSNDDLKSSMSLLFLMLISWEVLVKAHIFRHALDMKMFGAMALSFSLFFISVALSQLLVPV